MKPFARSNLSVLLVIGLTLSAGCSSSEGGGSGGGSGAGGANAGGDAGDGDAGDGGGATGSSCDAACDNYVALGCGPEDHETCVAMCEEAPATARACVTAADDCSEVVACMEGGPSSGSGFDVDACLDRGIGYTTCDDRACCAPGTHCNGTFCEEGCVTADNCGSVEDCSEDGRCF